MSNSHIFRILSLDGGGIRGLFTTGFLAHLEAQSQRPLVECFDLIVGTSTGGIIALGLARGMSASEILNFYRDQGSRIFGNPRPWLLRWVRPKYNGKVLYSALEAIFDGVRLNEARARLCITSYETVEGIPRVIKTDHAETLHWGGDQLMWKVAAATSAAPTYFPAFQIGEQDCHIDGGVWANNPVRVAITEAISRLRQSLDDLAVLSVGTGSQRFALSHEKARRMGKVQWARPSFDLILGSQSRAAHHEARLLLSSDRYVRVDVDLTEPIPLDDYEASLPLIERGYQAGRTNWATIANIFFA